MRGIPCEARVPPRHGSVEAAARELMVAVAGTVARDLSASRGLGH